MTYDYVYKHDHLVAQFVASLIPELNGRSLAHACKTMGVVNRDGELVAGVVWHNWDPVARTIEMSGSAIDPKWLRPETLRRMYGYPYLELDCQLTYMRVAATNQRLLRQLAAFNYSFITLPRMLGPGKDMVLCQLTIEAWRENRICQRYRHHEQRLQEAA